MACGDGKKMVTMQAPVQAATLNQRLASYLHGERFERIDPKAIARAKSLLAYHVGLAFRAIRLGADEGKQAWTVARELSGNCGASTVIGHAGKVTQVDAAMANCSLMRALGHDDVIFPAGIHPGLMTIPVALAVAEREHTSGREFLTALVIAYELMGKFGLWTWALDMPRRATMPFGPFGAVAAAARCLGLSAEKTSNALGYAAHTAMGLAEGDGMVTHWYGLVCRNGLTGAYMAKAGGWSSPTVLEGRYGFIDAFVGTDGSVDPDELVDSLGRDYVINHACEKRYPGTALNQVPIELTRDLVKEYRLAPADIASVKLLLPRERQNLASAHFRGPFRIRAHASSTVTFHVAIVLLDGETRLSRFDELDNPEILGLIDRIEIEFIDGKPIRYAAVELRRKDGSVLTREGYDFYFPSDSAATIMRRDAAGILPEAKIQRFLELHDRLEQLPDIAPLVECLGL